MRLSLISLLCLLLASPLFANPNPQPPHTGEIIVGYHDSYSADAARHEVHGAQRMRRLPVGGAELVRPDEDADFDAVLARYRSDPSVRYAEPNYVVELQAPLPDAEFIDRQWWICVLQQAGVCLDQPDSGSTNVAAAWESWRQSTGQGDPIGSRDVKLAIIDTGIWADHPDLSDNVRTDLGCEIRDTNENFDPTVPCTTPDFTDRNGHGTHIAGIVGAVTDRTDAAVAGINWRIDLIPIKALEDVGRGSVVDTSNAILYAMEQADGSPLVINASYGYRATAPSTYELEILQRAQEQDVLVIAAAGNDGCNNDDWDECESDGFFFPASHRLTNVIGVAASVRDGSRALYSRFGANTILIGAPGGDTSSSAGAIWSAYVEMEDDDGETTIVAGLSGTSMAAPMVAGAAALRWSLSPELTAAELREILTGTAVEDFRWDGVVLAGGRLDADAALTTALNDLDPMPASHLRTSVRSENSDIELRWLDNANRNTGYVVERQFESGDWEAISGVIDGDTEYWLDPGSEEREPGVYSYRVQAVGGSSAGCCTSATVTASIAPPMDRLATSGGGSSSPCFIATAAFGTPMAEEIHVLRAFRDDVLRKSAMGRWFIDTYETLSPPVAAYIAERPALRAVTRQALKPLVALIRWWRGS